MAYIEGYLIKATIQTGRHAGESYLLRKGGYVTDEKAIQWEEDVYKTLSSCKATCTKLAAANKRDHEWELREREWRKARGHEPDHEWLIHELETYEPFKVDEVLTWN